MGSVTTQDPTILSSGGSFNGQAFSFPSGDSLQVWYKYGEGITLPATPPESPKQTAISVFAGTTIPPFSVTKTCSDFSYQVVPDEAAAFAGNKLSLKSPNPTIFHF